MHGDVSGDATRRELAAALSAGLDALLAAWLPRVVDAAHGGYRSDFDHAWNARGPNMKMLEFQARTLRFFARAGLRRPELRASADHGFHFLRDRMWDAEQGGWFRLVDESGSPQAEHTKHGHGTAYAISACVWYHRLSGSEAALDLAEASFEWLDRFAHDREHGGYFSFYRRNGEPIVETNAAPAGHVERDQLGIPIGCKESNTLVDLIEALGDLFAVRPSPRVEERLRELLELAMTRALVDPGVLHMTFTTDWQPLPNLTSYAQTLQATRQVLDADRSLGGGSNDPAFVQRARRIVDHVVRIAWDRAEGGFHHAGPAFGEETIEGNSIFVPDKIWWGQAEGLRAFLALADRLPEADYLERAAGLWRYIDAFVVDRERGGWETRGRDCPNYDATAPKASIWKDPSHEGGVLVAADEMLSG